jgi:type IV secretory pathway protease TraF
MDGNMRGVVQGLAIIIVVSVAVIAGFTAADLMGQLPSRIWNFSGFGALCLYAIHSRRKSPPRGAAIQGA